MLHEVSLYYAMLATVFGPGKAVLSTGAAGSFGKRLAATEKAWNRVIVAISGWFTEAALNVFLRSAILFLN